MIIKSLIWIKTAQSEWQTRPIFRRSKCQIYRTIVRWPTVICSLVITTLFISMENWPLRAILLFLTILLWAAFHYVCSAESIIKLIFFHFLQSLYYLYRKTVFNKRWTPSFAVDFVSAPFCVSKSQIYEGIENPDTFFRPALRSLLVSVAVLILIFFQ